MSLELPTQKVPAEATDPELMILYAPVKAGKTTLLSHLENNLILDTEEGTKYLEALKLPIKSLDDLKEAGKKISDAGKPYKYITVDPVFPLEEMVKEDALAMYKSTTIGKSFEGSDILELPRGAGYYWLRQAFMKWVNKLRKLAPHIILCGHLKSTVIEKDSKEVEVKDLNLTGKIKDIVCQEADAIGYLYRGEDSCLRISFKSQENLVCGARPDHLKGQDLKIADYDPENNQLVNVEWNKVFKD